MGGTSQAAPHITGIATLAQQIAVENLGRKLTVSEFRYLLQTTGVIINDGDDENDSVTNTGLDFPRVDMQALAEAILTFNGEISNPDNVNPDTSSDDTPLYLPNDSLRLSHTVNVNSGEIVTDIDFGNQQLNTDPVLTTNNGLTVDEDAVSNITSAQLQVTDTDNTPSEIIYTVTDATDNGTLLLDGNVLSLDDTFTQADIDNNRLTYDQNGSETVSDSFNFTVADDAGGSIGSQTFDITVNPVNDAPVANNDTAITNQNEAVTIAVTQLLANDSDIEGDTLSISSVGNPINGSATVNGNNVIFTPNNNFSGEASFEYTVSDGNTTDIATVSLTVIEIPGNQQRNVLTGDSSDNIIAGYQGRDMLTGGDGNDQFVYISLRDAGDIITDFEVGSDTIVLTELLKSFDYTDSDPIGDGYVSVGSSRGSAFVQVDQDGAGGNFISRPLVLLQGVTVENLSANADNSFIF